MPNSAEYMKKWEAEHREQRLQYWRDRHKATYVPRPPREPVYIDCGYCGAPFERTSSNNRYCSVRCRNRAKTMRRRGQQ